MSGSRKSTGGGGREDRLAEALRANLRRRKAPRASESETAPDAETPPQEPAAENPAKEAPSDDENSAPSSP